MDAINPTAVATALACAAVPIYHLLIKKPAAKDAGDKPPLRRRSSILEAVIGWFMTFLVSAEGLLMYFLTDGYASFWGYGPLDPISSFATIGEGYSLVMLATFWACLLRKKDVWKAYGAASIVYFLATVDATFIRKYELDVTEVGTEVDLVLSFISVVATEAWTVFL